ncbi:MAG: acyl carrier protein [Eubacteriales bacterium]|jgi:acyl carrier protein
MSKEQIKDLVMELIVDQLDVKMEELTMETNLMEDLGADSLDIADLVMELEERLEVEISDEELAKLKTVGDIVAYVENIKKD